MELCVIEGDSVGREVVPAAVRVLKTILPEVVIHNQNGGYDYFKENNTPLPQQTIDCAMRCRAILFGAANSPSFPVEGYFELATQLRRLLNIYSSLRPTQYLPVATARDGVDLVIVHESTEGLYMVDEPGHTDTQIITRNATEQVAKKTYQLAVSTHRSKVTIVHKANILTQSDGLFRRVALEVAEQYPEIETDELLVDTAAYWMVKEPARFDMILTTHMYGDILSDMAAAWGGGLGLVPTVSLGDDAAIAQPVHGAAPDIAGQNIANPTATILSVALLLRHHWRLPDYARRIEEAVHRTLKKGYHTPDINPIGAISTIEFTDQVIAHLS